ncbi:MAG: B12-binding domain-containing radical SAM protein [Armatimonadota bacterium]
MGFPIVLTADRTLMSRYNVLLDGMMAASQTTSMPAPVVKTVLMPRAAHPHGQCLVAPLGLRRIEAMLAQAGLGEQLTVVDDAHLQHAIGPETKIIAISSGEPAGLGMSSSTMTGVIGGSIYPHAMFRRLLAQVTKLRQERCPKAKIILGGPGAWQLADHVGRTSKSADLQKGGPVSPPHAEVDHVICGYAEGNAPRIFQDLLADRPLPYLIEGQPVSAAQVPPILHPSTMAVVEISRGCGLGCDFCTIGSVAMQHLPPETILSDIQTNLSAGLTSAAILSEDLLRYEAEGVRCRPERLLALLAQIRNLPGLRIIQPDHVNVASVAQYNDTQLSEIHRLLTGGYQDTPWVNLGIETPSGALLQANGGRPKMGGVASDQWGDFCAQQLRRLIRAGFVPMASLVIGLPGETPEDIELTRQWVRALRGEPVTVFPVLYAPIGGQAPPEPSRLSRAHWQLMSECYEFNFRGVPRIYWDSQRGAGVGLPRRLVIQALGQGNVLLWRNMLKLKVRRAS